MNLADISKKPVLFIGICLASVAMFSSRGFLGLFTALLFLRNAYGYQERKIR